MEDSHRKKYKNKKEREEEEENCVVCCGVTLVPNGMIQSPRICKGGGVCLSI
jgi:hypothetical protein